VIRTVSGLGVVWVSKPGSRYAKSRFAGETRVRPPGLKASDSLGNDSSSRRTGVFETLKVAPTAWLRLGESAGCAQRVEGVLEVAWWRKAMLAIGGRIRRSRRRRASIGAAWSRPSIFALSVQRQRLETGYGSARCAHAIPLQIDLIRASDRVYAPCGLNPPAWHPSSSSVPILSGTGAPRLCRGALPCVCVCVWS